MGLNFPFPGAPCAFAIPADQTRITARAVITIMKRFRIGYPFYLSIGSFTDDYKQPRCGCQFTTLIQGRHFRHIPISVMDFLVRLYHGQLLLALFPPAVSSPSVRVLPPALT